MCVALAVVIVDPFPLEIEHYTHCFAMLCIYSFMRFEKNITTRI